MYDFLFFLLLNTEEDILKNAGTKTVDIPIELHSMDKEPMEVNGYINRLPTFFKKEFTTHLLSNWCHIFLFLCKLSF